MANAFANHNSRNFWKEVRNINRSCSCKSYTPVIDGFHGADNNYCPTFFKPTSHSSGLSSSSTCDSRLGQINDNLVSDDLNLVSISIPCVRSALSLLK